MANFILEKFNDIIVKACERFGKEHGLAKEAMQIVMRVDGDGDVVYDLLKEYKKIKEIKFLEILNVRIDFRGYSMLVPPFIANTLGGYAKELEADVQNLSAMCVVNGDDVVICLYRGTEYVKQIDLDEEL